MTSSLLQALAKKNRSRPPIWLMRQAGRYLPEYRRLREKYSLKDLFFTPELAVQVTKMPLERFGFDAAILFSDITVVAEALDLPLSFSEGPKLKEWVTPASVHKLGATFEKLSPIIEVIHLLKKDLSVPLLGFCGAPFTVASYLVGSLEMALSWMHKDPKSFQVLLEKIADATSAYLKMQVDAKVDAIQIFDSWANHLTPDEFFTYSLPFIQRFVNEVKVPCIFFMRGIGPYIDKIPCAVSVDETVCLQKARQLTDQPLQGNLNPELLFQPLDVIKEKTLSILQDMQKDPAFIFNLGHGIKPNTPLEAIYCLVETVDRL